MISIIIPVNDTIYNSEYRSVIEKSYDQGLDTEIIWAINNDERYNLAKARNNAVKRSNGEWLWFADFDTTFPNMKLVTELNYDIIAGKYRRDLNNELGTSYKVGFAPLYLKKSIFLEVGGYCEEFCGYGYEDSDFEHKLPTIHEIDAEAIHMMEIHNFISSTNKMWRSDTLQNDKLFWDRQKLSLQERINKDKLSFQL